MAGKENAMIELTEEQRQELEYAEPACVRDPKTNETYVLVRTEVYERIRHLLDESLDMRQVAILVDRAMREDDANDPTLEFYQHK
jgi:hypothetical protein